MSDDLTTYLELRAENDRLKRHIRKLQCENSTLRALTGRKKRKARKTACMENYKPGMTGGELAKLSGCSVRYANSVIADIKKALEN